MKAATLLSHFCALSAIGVLAAAPASAQPSLQTTLMPIYQVGNGDGVSMGHVVHASTVYNRLTAGGTFLASCANGLMLPANGQRTLSTDNFAGGLSLHVTIPQVLPATVSMPGFYSLPRGTTVQCTYAWTSKATEGGYTISASGISFQSGNGERTDGFFKPFQMNVPGDTSTDDWQSCIP
jgi:hypothetical protein